MAWKRAIAALIVGLVFAFTIQAQRPGDGGGDGPPRGRPRFRLGSVLPPPIAQRLELSDSQRRQISDLESEVKSRLQKILSAEQIRQIDSMDARPQGPPDGNDDGPPERGRPRKDAKRKRNDNSSVQRRPLNSDTPPVRPVSESRKLDTDLAKNCDLERSTDGKVPDGFQIEGATTYGNLGNHRDEVTGRGVRFDSRQSTGKLQRTVELPRNHEKRWLRFRIRALAQSGFAADDLFLKVEFFSGAGQTSLDGVRKSLFEQVENDRQDLTANGVEGRNGASVWRSYDLEFRLPFAEIDQLKLTVGFRGGKGKSTESEFWIDDFEIQPMTTPSITSRSTNNDNPPTFEVSSLHPMGGKWYLSSLVQKPAVFDAATVGNLLFVAGRPETPFADNATAWLRRGYLDKSGNLVEQDRFVPNNLIVSFTKSHLVLKTRNLPNHPTANFPKSTGSDANPNYIQERERTFYLPLEPKVNAKHKAMTTSNRNRALNMGPIGVAINGVVFFNPFDADMEDAASLMDTCCGHPAPDNTYHYHKYPVCVKSPWSDDGKGHSPVIGWAFDGFPIYGPYESAGEMAKDCKSNPLNEFNVHFDKERGWHYHVTPGKFPYIIGGYWGDVEKRNLSGPGLGG